MNGNHGSTSVSRFLLSVLALALIVIVATFLLLQLNQAAALSSGEFAVVQFDPGNTTVDEGEMVDVAATIENTGDASETQMVILSLGGEKTRESITLEPGERRTIWLQGIDVGTLGIGETTYSVRTEDEHRTATLTVTSDRPPAFDVNGLRPGDLTLEDGQRVDVSASIENSGGTDATQTVELRLDGQTYFQRPVTLGPGEREPFVVSNLDFGWLGPGNHTYSIHTANDSDTGTIFVPKPATFELRSFEPGNVTLDARAQFPISVSVANTGDFAADGRVQLVVDGQILRTKDVGLDPGGETTVVFEAVNASRIGIGVHSYWLTVGDERVTGTLTVEGQEPGQLSVSSLEPGDTTVDRGGRFNVSATIMNTGERTVEGTVELRFDGVSRYSTTVELAPGEAESFDVSNVSLAGLRSGEYTYGVFTEADNETGTVLIPD